MTSTHPEKDSDDVRMSFGEHLEELRLRIILALGGVLLGFIICLAFARQAFAIVIRPAYIVLKKYNQDAALQALSPPDSFLIYLKIAALGGLIISSWWVIWQAWQFVAAGLYDREKRYVRLAILPSIALFAIGVIFMYFIVLPVVFNFFVGFSQSFPVPDWPPNFLERQLVGEPQAPSELPPPADMPVPIYNGAPPDPTPGDLWFDQDSSQLKIVGADGEIHSVITRSERHRTTIQNQYSINFYVSFILRLSLAFGIAFQLPLVVIFLAVTRLVEVQTMVKGRSYVILSIAISAAVLTPPDVVSQILLGVPMFLLFEGGLLTARIMLRRRR